MSQVLRHQRSTSQTHHKDDSISDERKSQISTTLPNSASGLHFKPSKIMDFYGLDTLTPETWNDDSEYQNGGTRDANVPENEENEDGQSVNTFNAPSAQVVIDDLEDLSDPLGVKSLSYATKSRSMVKKKGAVMLTSKEFDAKKFLADVHRGTTFKNLEEGYERLNVTVEQRTEKLKSLVKGNFDRFVGAKATVDAIYKELKSKNLNSEDYGTDKFKKKLKDVSDACGSLYGPIIERRLKAEKIRSVLGVLERYRFFFNLPASLEELIKANKYEQAVRDVKKGKSMLNTAFPGIFSKESKEKSSGSIKNGGLEAVFDKVWNEVERITDILREFLFNELSDMKIDMEQQERNINLLHELNHEVGMKDPSSKLSEDPLSFYLKCFNDWILRQFDVKKGEYSTKAPKLLNSELLISTPKIENVKFKRGVFVSVRGDYEKVFGRDLEVEYWKSLTVFVKDLSSFLVTSLPDFYRLTKPMLLSQSKQVTSPVSPSKKKAFNSTTLYSKADAEKCRRMVSEILNRYSMIVEEVLAPILAKDSEQVTSIVSCVHFTPQIVKDLSSTYDSISDVLKQSLKIDEAIVKNDLLALSNVSNRIKSFALDKLLHLWKVEASLFYQRDYFDSPDSGYLSLLHKFQKLVLSSLADILRSSTHNNLQFLQNVVSGFVESVYLLLDGLHYLVFDVEDKSNEIHEKKTLVILSCVYSLRFEYLDKWVGLIKQLSVAGPDFLKAEDLDNMKDTIDHLTQLLFSFYIKSKRHVLSSIVKKGCMLSGYDWNTSAKPEGVSPFVNEALMYLVFIHSQIYSLITVPELLKRIFSTLLHALLLCFQENLRSIDSFSLCSALQAIVNLSAIMDVVKEYATSNKSLLALERIIVNSIQENCNDTIDLRGKHGAIIEELVSEWRKSGEISRFGDRRIIRDMTSYSDVYSSLPRNPPLLTQLLPKLRVEAILVADFDIDIGSSLSYCYPSEFLPNVKRYNKITDQYLAELMLPDGAHLRDEDWTFFYLNQKPQVKQTGVLPYCIGDSLSIRVLKKEGDVLSYEGQPAIIKLEAEKVLIKIQEGAITQEVIFDEEFEINKSTDNVFTLEQKPNTVSFTIDTRDDEDKWKAYQKYHAEKSQNAESKTKKKQREPLLYCINLVRTKHIAGIKRGARVKAMAICTRHQFLHVFRPLLILALEKFFQEPSDELLQQLYTSLNQVDISSMPTLSLTEKLVLRGGNFGVLYSDDPADEQSSSRNRSVGKFKAGTDLKGDLKITFDGTRNYWEGKVDFDTISVPLKIPLDYLPDEVGDFSVTNLINTFHNQNAKPGEASGFMTILHSVISEKRVLFLGHNMPALETSRLVLAAASLCAPVLKGHIERTFPYTNLINVDNMIEIDGYIAGVANPAFQLHDTWWDVLCDISSKKVILSSKLNAGSAYGWVPNGAQNEDSDKEKDLIARDADFMNELLGMIQNKFNDIQIRQRISRYVKHFVEVSATFEYDSANGAKSVTTTDKVRSSKPMKLTRSRSKSFLEKSTNDIGSNSDFKESDRSKTDEKAVLIYGPRAVFADEATKKKELQLYSKRVKQWKGTVSYGMYLTEWNQKIQKRILLNRLSSPDGSEAGDNFSGADLSTDVCDTTASSSSLTKNQFRPRIGTSIVSGSYKEKLVDSSLQGVFTDENEVSFIINKLKNMKNLDNKETVRIYEALLSITKNEDGLLELLSVLPANDGGIIPLCIGLYHTQDNVRKLASKLLLRISESKVGTMLITRLNPFLALALRRVLTNGEGKSNLPHNVLPSGKKHADKGKRYFDENKNPFDHLVDSTTSLSSAWSIPSYISYRNLATKSVNSVHSVGTPYRSQDLISSYKQLVLSTGTLPVLPGAPLEKFKRSSKENKRGSKNDESSSSINGATGSHHMSNPQLERETSQSSLHNAQAIRPQPPSSLPPIQVSKQNSNSGGRKQDEQNSSKAAKTESSNEPVQSARPRSGSISMSIARFGSASALTNAVTNTISQGFLNVQSGITSLGKTKSQQSMQDHGIDSSKPAVQFLSHNADGGASFFTPYIWPENETPKAAKEEKGFVYNSTISKIKGFGAKARGSISSKGQVPRDPEETDTSNNPEQDSRKQPQKRSALDIFRR